MALYDDELRKAQAWRAQLNAQEQAAQAQADYERRMRESAERSQAAQNKITNPLEAVLSGIGNSIKNVGDTLYNMAGTGVASIRDLGDSIFGGKGVTTKNQDDWKEYAKKTIYGDENLSDKDYYAKTGGKALDAAATVSDFIPGLGKAAKVGLNVAQGGLSGVAQNYIDNGANVSLEDALRGGLTGLASAGVGQAVGGKLANKVAGPNAGIVSRALYSNLGKGAITGAVSGATGAGLNTALSGGNLGDVLGSAVQGAQGGAIGGATTAGVMGLAGTAADKLKNKVLGNNIADAATATKPLTQQPIAETETTETQLITKGTPEYDEIIRRDKIDNKRRELKNTVTGGIRDQYGTTRLNDRINGLNDAIMDVADLGLTKRSQIDGFANRITGADGEVPKIIRKSLKDAGDTSSRLNITMQDVYDSVGADKTAQKRIQSFFDAQSKKYSVDENGKINRLDMYDLGKSLEKEGYKMVDRGERTQNSTTTAYGEGLIALSRATIDQATDGVSIKANIDINKLKNTLPGNEKWAAKVDDFANSAETVQDARKFIESPTKMSLLAQAAEFNEGTYGQRVGDMGKDASAAIRAGTSANPIAATAQIVAAKAADSDANKQRIIKKALKNLNNIDGTGNNDFKSTAAKVVSNIADKTKTALGNTAAALNNDTITSRAFGGSDLGLPTVGELITSQTARQAGLSQSRNMDALRELQQAQTDANNAQTDYRTQLGAAEQAYSQAQQMANTSNGILDRIASAMDQAMAVGDVSAWNELSKLYQEAQNIYGATTNTSPYSNLSAAQIENINKMDTAENAINQLEQLYAQAGGGKGVLGGNAANFMASLGLNNDVATYNALARGLINQISAATGKTDTLNTEGEVKRALELIPQFTDTQEVAQAKLESLRQMLAGNRQATLNNYGVTQAQ